jgi:hypothetical protein
MYIDVLSPRAGADKSSPIRASLDVQRTPATVLYLVAGVRWPPTARSESAYLPLLAVTPHISTVIQYPLVIG